MEASETFIVTAGDTARRLGSGSLDVLGTPRLLAWCEAVTCTAIADTLTPATTSVGTRVAFEHLVASRIGAEVVVRASAAYTDGRLVRFAVSARSGGKLLASGEITRVVVDTDKFLSRL